MSRAATPARKANALIEELAKLDRSEVLDDLALGRLAREAQALMKWDAAGAHTVLGGIAGFEGDAAKVREHHVIALRLSARDRQVLGNYATSLTNVGEMDDAFATIMEAHERYPDDAYVLKGAIRDCSARCQVRRKSDPVRALEQAAAGGAEERRSPDGGCGRGRR